LRIGRMANALQPHAGDEHHVVRGVDPRFHVRRKAGGSAEV
jgi:hypothetical protein